MPVYTLFPLTIPAKQGGIVTNPQSDAMVDATLMGRPSKALALDLYAPTAIVDCADLDDLYGQCQNLDAPWTQKHPPLLMVGPQRSLCSGDFVYENDTQRILFCANVGWTDMSDVHEAKIIRQYAETIADAIRNTPQQGGAHV
jgi:hypothetical protein